MTDRLTRQITFLVEADKLKNIIRRTPLVDSSRLEKDRPPKPNGSSARQLESSGCFLSKPPCRECGLMCSR